MKNPVFYELLLKSEQNGDEVSIVWKWIQTLNMVGEKFAPRYLNMGGGQNEKLEFTGPEVVNALLTRRRINTRQGSSSSFILFTDEPGIMIGVTIATENIFTINFPTRVAITDVIPILTLHDLFSKCVLAIDPYWACIMNGDNDARLHGILNSSRRYRLEDLLAAGYTINNVDDRKVPHLIHWYNYFGPEFVHRLGGREKLLAGPVWQAEEVEKLDGIIWILGPEPFDDTNQDQRDKQIAAMEYLNLFDIHKHYMLS